MGPYFLGIDVGTASSKAVLIDQQCKPVVTASRAHQIDNPQPSWYQMDADSIWWGDLSALTRQVIRESGIDPHEIGCVGLSALGCDCVPVDDRCHTLAPAILYGIDARATEEIGELRTAFAGHEEAVFGHPICSSDIAPKILWFKHHMPDVWEHTVKFLTASSYLCARLTGAFTIDAYLAEDFMPLYNLAKGTARQRAARISAAPTSWQISPMPPISRGTLPQRPHMQQASQRECPCSSAPATQGQRRSRPGSSNPATSWCRWGLPAISSTLPTTWSQRTGSGQGTSSSQVPTPSAQARTQWGR